MIHDRVEGFRFYGGLGRGLFRALSLLASGEAAAFPEGRHDLGEGLLAILSRYVPREADAEPYETHRRYLDVQAVLAGGERMGYAPASSLMPLGPYDEGEDCVLYRGEGAWLPLLPGWFAVLGVQDAHQPGVCLPGFGGEVCKVVFKVPLT